MESRMADNVISISTPDDRPWSRAEGLDEIELLRRQVDRSENLPHGAIDPVTAGIIRAMLAEVERSIREDMRRATLEP
jgi:hypothetical protein